MTSLVAFNRLVLDLLFPRRCVGCNKEGQWICVDCRTSLQPRFFEHEIGGFSVTSLFDFETRLVRELLHNLKYDGVRDIATELREVITGWGESFLPADAVLIPIPLSKARLKTRGYNQAEELVVMLGSLYGLPVWREALVRTGNTKTQVGRTATERSVTEKGFAWGGKEIPASFREKTWVLIDDLMTTGSTLKACFEILQKQTTNKISGLTIAWKS